MARNKKKDCPYHEKVKKKAKGRKISVKGIIPDGDQVLLVKAKKNDRWELPGGKMNPGELVSDALAREIFEETGLMVEPKHLVKTKIRKKKKKKKNQLLVAVFECDVADSGEKKHKKKKKVKLGDEHTDHDFVHHKKAKKKKTLRPVYTKALAETPSFSLR